MLTVLAKAKRLRGTPLDPFGRAHVRKLERELLSEFTQVVDQLLGCLSIANLDEAARIAGLPDIVRGYEDRKVRNAATYRDELQRALQAWPTC